MSVTFLFKASQAFIPSDPSFFTQCVSLLHPFFSGGDKHQPGSVGQVSEVQQEVQRCEHRYSDQV